MAKVLKKLYSPAVFDAMFAVAGITSLIGIVVDTGRRYKAIEAAEPLTKGGALIAVVVASAALTGDLVTDEEDVCATAAAIALVLLAATERGLASYWRTPAFLRTARGREAAGIPDGERVLGLLHFGTPVRQPSQRERSPLSEHLRFLR